MNTPVNFEIATSLKEKGFDNLSEWAYQSGKLVHDSRNKEHKNWNKEKHVDCTAPTISEVIMWLYEKHGIWIYPLPIDDDMKLWQARIIKGEPFNKLSNTLKIISHGEISYKSMYSPAEAYEAAIEYTLNNLI